MEDELKQRLINRLRQVGAYDVRISDPKAGYEHALPGKHPLEIWNQCKSIVVFAIACSPKANNSYLGTYSPWIAKNRNVGPVPKYVQSDIYAMDRVQRLFVASFILKGMTLLQQNGHNVMFSEQLQFKLAAFEAGIGVYGRSGQIIHPVLGSRIRLGLFLTDAVLEPDNRLHGFEPCVSCDKCINLCPAKAFDPTKDYPLSYSREKCEATRAQIEDKGLYCHNCYAVCPAGKLKDDELLYIAEAKSFLKRDRGIS